MLKVIVPLAVSSKGHKNFPIHFVRSSYLKKLKRYQLMPIFVHTLMTQTMLAETFSKANGLFLTGGADIDPVLYQAQTHPKTKAKEKERDRLEISLVKQAVKEKKPILAICRGLQLVNVSLGGTLIQHLPDSILNEKHSASSYQALKTNRTHPVKVIKNSRLYQIVKSTKIQVKSHHHQAVDKLGQGLKVSATSPAGVIEAIETTAADFFLVGLQSHPETETNGDLEPVFAAFAKAVKQYQKKSK